jgi:hypothetical protein
MMRRQTVSSWLSNKTVSQFVFYYRDVFYSGPRKVTITVKETKTETGYPGETELISSHITTSTAPAASTATRELDDLMASLSGIKVSDDFCFTKRLFCHRCLIDLFVSNFLSTL